MCFSTNHFRGEYLAICWRWVIRGYRGVRLTRPSCLAVAVVLCGMDRFAWRTASGRRGQNRSRRRSWSRTASSARTLSSRRLTPLGVCIWCMVACAVLRMVVCTACAVCICALYALCRRVLCMCCMVVLTVCARGRVCYMCRIVICTVCCMIV